MPEPITGPVEELAKLRDDWAMAIGRFLVAFGGCEYWTYLYIQTLGSERAREAVGHTNLGSRLRIAHALVSDLGLIQPIQERVNAAFKKFKVLASPRNLVAHNGPMVHVYRNAETGALDVRHELRSARDPSKDITIDELGKLHSETIALEEELALLYGLIRNAENRL